MVHELPFNKTNWSVQQAILSRVELEDQMAWAQSEAKATPLPAPLPRVRGKSFIKRLPSILLP